jgi:hypothetical protein
MAADRFTDVGDVVGRAVMRGEQAVLRRRAVENRRQELQAQAIAQLPMLDESQVPEQMREYAMTEAMNIRNEAIAAIQDKNITPVERQLAISKAMGKVNKIATQAGDFKQWIANLAEMGQDDLSKLNSPELMARVDDIYKGNFVVQDGQFIFEDGETKDFGSLVNTRPISRRSDAYLQQLQVVGKEYEKYGLQGWDEASFNNKIENEVKNIKYTDADLASILVDEMGDELGDDLKAQIKDDFEDNGEFDTLSKENLVKIVSDRYKAAARDAYNRSKELYNKKVSEKIALEKAKASGKGESSDTDVILGAQEATKLLNNPSEYFRSVSGDKTDFNETTREFSLITYDDEGNEVPIVYDLLNENDITRLFNEIQTNKSYTAAVRKKLEEGLKKLIASPQFAEYQRRGELQRRPTTGPIDTGNLPIGFTQN